MDCMSHGCRCQDDHGRVKLDACCQHGADVLLPEKAAFQLEVTADRGDAVNDFGPQIQKQT